MITVNINKAKSIAHNARRAARLAEFAPLDIKATIPSEAVAVEVERQAVRKKYTDMQISIESSQDISSLKHILDMLKT